MRGETEEVTLAVGSPVSVVIPARNAETTLPETLEAIFSQDYPGEVEVIVADGSDTAATAEVVRGEYPQVRLIRNHDQGIPAGLNRAIEAASHRIIVRCDAHAIFPPGYLRRIVETLAATGAANVGGRQDPIGTSVFERASAAAITSRLGSGGARYRIGGSEGPIDTVYLGAFRREALEAIGGYDHSLARNEDYELNWRLRERGEMVWFDPDLAVAYRPRSGFRALARQYFDYGRWKSSVLRQYPASIRTRHLAPPLLVMGLAASAALALAGAPTLAAAVPAAYLVTLVAGSVTIGIRRRDWAVVLLPLVLATMHLSWGVGFFLKAHRMKNGKPGGRSSGAGEGASDSP